MSRWHNADGTVRDLSERLVKILDGAVERSLAEEHELSARSIRAEARTSLHRARTHEQVATAAVRASYWLARRGDIRTADLIRDVMEGR
jgi:hypothetical protein